MGKNAKIMPIIWHILIYLLFKNFALVIRFSLTSSKTYIKKVKI